MGTPKSSEGGRSRRSSARTPEARENELISLAYDLVEKRIRAGTASSQETTVFIKAGSSRERLEQERLRHEGELAKVKMKAIEDQAQVLEMYSGALEAMKSYSPSSED